MEEKPLSGLWRNDAETPEGNFVIGAKDPAAPAALRIIHGSGDPDRGRHRKDDLATIEEMRGGKSS